MLTAVLLLTSQILSAQRFRNGIKEIGFMLGGSNYWGDLAPSTVMAETGPSLGLFYKYHHSRFFSSRWQFAYAHIGGSDANFKANAYRNLSFESDIYELGYFTEFNFRPFGINRSQHEEKSTTFVFAGINLFLFEPVRKLQGGDRVELRDIGTEGQKMDGRRTYSPVQPALTMGFGYKFNIRRSTVIGLEFGVRKTFTDYLDDTGGKYPDYNALVAKQGIGAGEFSHAQTMNEQPPAKAGTMRGDRHLSDWYFIAGITISFRNVIGDPCAGL